MLKYFFSVFLIIFLFFTSCGSENKVDIKNIHLLNDIIKLDKIIKFKISTDESIIGQVNDIKFFKNGYLLMDSYVSKKVAYFDKKGNFLKTIGKIGQGPGEYNQPKTLFVSQNDEVFIFNMNPLKLNIYNENLTFKKNVKFPSKYGFLDVFKVISKNDMYYFYTPRADDLGYKVITVDENFKIIKSIGKDESLMKKFLYVGGDIEFVNNNIWVANVFNPIINVYNLNGNKLRQLGEHLKNKNYCMNEKIVNKIKTNDLGRFFNLLKSRSVTRYIINLGSKYVIVGNYLYNKKAHFDIYDNNGNLLKNQVVFDVNKYLKKGYLIVNSNNGKFFLIDNYSDALDEENLSAIAYEFSVK